MYYWRYMSSEELLKYLEGYNITRREDAKNGHTTGPSNVLFFFDENIVAKSNSTTKVIHPKETYDFMYGLFDYDFFVRFSSDLELQESIGVYVDTITPNAGFFDVMSVNERYIESYNTSNMIIDEVYDLRENDMSMYKVDFALLLDTSFIKGEGVQDD